MRGLRRTRIAWTAGLLGRNDFLVSWLLGGKIHLLFLRVFRIRADRGRRTSRSNHGGLIQRIPIDQLLAQSPIA
jgi:hypothetical protein